MGNLNKLVEKKQIYDLKHRTPIYTVEHNEKRISKEEQALLFSCWKFSLSCTLAS
jgi:hypothetical protein